MTYVVEGALDVYENNTYKPTLCLDILYKLHHMDSCLYNGLLLLWDYLFFMEDMVDLTQVRHHIGYHLLAEISKQLKRLIIL